MIARALALVVRLYRAVVSPLFPPACRFSPSCSAYALDALEIHGAWRGSRLIVRRILRCHPFHPGGIDPVPPDPRAERRSAGSAAPGSAQDVSTWTRTSA